MNKESVLEHLRKTKTPFSVIVSTVTSRKTLVQGKDYCVVCCLKDVIKRHTNKFFLKHIAHKGGYIKQWVFENFSHSKVVERDFTQNDFPVFEKMKKTGYLSKVVDIEHGRVYEAGNNSLKAIVENTICTN